MTIKLHISKYSNKFWYNNNAFHNNYKPAVEQFDGTKFWYVNNQPHRVDGPAIEWASGSNEWWVNNVKYFTYLEYMVAVEEYKKNMLTTC